jgi:hypothetical protein
MRKVKYLLSNINLINIILALLLIFLTNYMALPFLRMNAAFTLPRVKKPAVEKVTPDEKTAEEKSPSPSDYVVIAEQNLFHPERIIPVPKVEAPPGPPLPEPDFVLYGTLITDGLQVAYMEDKKAPDKEKKDTRKKQTALRKGDTMSGFILVEVHDDKVVMKRGGAKEIVVSLNEPKVRETPVAAAAAPAVAKGAAASPQAERRGVISSTQRRRVAQRPEARAPASRERLRSIRERSEKKPGASLF